MYGTVYLQTTFSLLRITEGTPRSTFLLPAYLPLSTALSPACLHGIRGALFLEKTIPLLRLSGTSIPLVSAFWSPFPPFTGIFPRWVNDRTVLFTTMSCVSQESSKPGFKMHQNFPEAFLCRETGSAPVSYSVRLKQRPRLWVLKEFPECGDDTAGSEGPSEKPWSKLSWTPASALLMACSELGK